MAANKQTSDDGFSSYFTSDEEEEMSNLILMHQKGEKNESRVNQNINVSGPDDVVTLLGDIGRPTSHNLDHTLAMDTTSVGGDAGTNFCVFSDLYNSIESAIESSRELDERYGYSAKTENYQPIYTILKNKKIQVMFEYAYSMKIVQNGQNEESSNMCTYETIENAFRDRFGYHLSDFRTDQRKMYSGLSARQFITLQLIYVMRWEQRACALCDVEIVDKTFGAIGFDSDHIWENEKEDHEEGTKSFELYISKSGKKGHSSCLVRCVTEIIREFGKTHLVCGDCHNRRGNCSKKWRDSYELPSLCFGTYSEDFRSFSQVIESRDGERVRDLQQEIFGKLPKLTYENITSKVELLGFDLRDVLFVGSDEWNANHSKRNNPIRRMFLNILKRMTGGCFRCDKKYSNKKILSLCGMEAHHIVESSKKCEPSRLASREYDYMENELKKCISLCKVCHQSVTHIEEYDLQLNKKMRKMGYYVKKESGEIGYDGDKKKAAK